jgi:hypothetical protein
MVREGRPAKGGINGSIIENQPKFDLFCPGKTGYV